MASVITTLKRLAGTDDEGPVCICAECGTHYDASQRGCPVCTEFDVEQETRRGGSESRPGRPP